MFLEEYGMSDTNVKPGIKSSEFFVLLATAIAGVALSAGWLKSDDAAQVVPWLELAQQIIGAILTVFAGGAYTASRTAIKKQAASR